MKTTVYRRSFIAFIALCLVMSLFAIGASAASVMRPTRNRSADSDSLAADTADENGVVGSDNTSAPGTGEFGDDTSNNGANNGSGSSGNAAGSGSDNSSSGANSMPSDTTDKTTNRVENAVDDVVDGAENAVDDMTDGMSVWSIVIIIIIIAVILVLVLAFFTRRR